ncbi:hypothetical protein FACS1894217_11230 [Clostridia bacterium]|nr:hypothetical protein FACS1894217_11230 [Clostridia bacterium]
MLNRLYNRGSRNLGKIKECVTYEKEDSSGKGNDIHFAEDVTQRYTNILEKINATFAEGDSERTRQISLLDNALETQLKNFAFSEVASLDMPDFFDYSINPLSYLAKTEGFDKDAFAANLRDNAADFARKFANAAKNNQYGAAISKAMATLMVNQTTNINNLSFKDFFAMLAAFPHDNGVYTRGAVSENLLKAYQRIASDSSLSPMIQDIFKGLV